jgi:hypothetical protein
MGSFIYRCPATGQDVQARIADDAPANEANVYETVKCLACTRTHLINKSTGRVLGR